MYDLRQHAALYIHTYYFMYIEGKVGDFPSNLFMINNADDLTIVV